jgi:hypothetical protein
LEQKQHRTERFFPWVHCEGEKTMSDEKQTIVGRTTSSIGKFKGEELAYFLVTVLSLIGVGITDYAPTQSWVYWFFMIAVFATLAIVLEKLQVSRKELPFSKLLVTQLIHWGGTLLAVLISFSFVKTGRMTYDGDGLLILLILSLATFLDGVHVGWRFYLAGLLLGLTTIFASYFEEFMWMILAIAVISIVFAIYLEKYLTSRRD